MLKFKIFVLTFLYPTSIYSAVSQPLYLAITALSCFTAKKDNNNCKIIYYKQQRIKRLGEGNPQLEIQKCRYKKEKKTKKIKKTRAYMIVKPNKNKLKKRKSFDARSKQKERRWAKEATGESHYYGKLSQKYSAKEKRGKRRF